MQILTRAQLLARLSAGRPLRVRGDGSAWVEFKDAGLDDKRVPAA